MNIKKSMMPNLNEIQTEFEYNIGTDIIEISQFKNKSFNEHESFYKKIFTASEILHCRKFSEPYSHFAGIFAAKEAIIKSSNSTFSMKEIEIFWNGSGRPMASIKNKQEENIKISISHSESFAIATALSFSLKN